MFKFIEKRSIKQLTTTCHVLLVLQALFFNLYVVVFGLSSMLTLAFLMGYLIMLWMELKSLKDTIKFKEKMSKFDNSMIEIQSDYIKKAVEILKEHEAENKPKAKPKKKNIKPKEEKEND